MSMPKGIGKKNRKFSAVKKNHRAPLDSRRSKTNAGPGAAFMDTILR